MITEQDYTKRLLKELVDYYLSHGMHDITIKIDYQEDESVTICLSAPYDKLPADLEAFKHGLAVEKQPELDAIYNSLLGSHSRDKNYAMLGKTIDEFEVSTINQEFKVQVKRYAMDQVVHFFE